MGREMSITDMMSMPTIVTPQTQAEERAERRISKGLDIINARWRVLIQRVSGKGPEEEIFYIDEIDELASIIEKGPNWYTTAFILITLNPNHRRGRMYSVEYASEL